MRRPVAGQNAELTRLTLEFPQPRGERIVAAGGSTRSIKRRSQTPCSTTRRLGAGPGSTFGEMIAGLAALEPIRPELG